MRVVHEVVGNRGIKSALKLAKSNHEEPDPRCVSLFGFLDVFAGGDIVKLLKLVVLNFHCVLLCIQAQCPLNYSGDGASSNLASLAIL